MLIIRSLKLTAAKTASEYPVSLSPAPRRAGNCEESRRIVRTVQVSAALRHPNPRLKAEHPVFITCKPAPIP